MEYKSDDYESTSQSIAVIALLIASNVSSENANDILTIMADGGLIILGLTLRFAIRYHVSAQTL